jgi:hypothetical protein
MYNTYLFSMQKCIIFKPFTKHMTYIQSNNRYHGGNRDRKEKQIFEYLGKISHL